MKKRITLFFLLSLFAVAGTLDAQTKVKKKDINRVTDQAEEAFYNEDYRLALSLYEKLFQMNPEGIDYYNYQIALCYLYSNIDNEKAMTYIDMAKEAMAETPVSDFYYYNLGKSLHLNNKYDEAISAYQKALDTGVLDGDLEEEIEARIQECRNAGDITKKPLEVKISNLKEGINTQFSEYHPLITADESILVFTSRRTDASNGHKDTDGRNFEDIYFSERDPLGFWKEPQKISSSINTELHEAGVGLSADGTELILYKGNPDWGGLFVSKQVGTEWTIPRMLGENINSKKYHETSASVSADGNTIYFVSDRKGTIGGKDIWKAGKGPNGEWGIPQNLGKMINTQVDEESPFIHPDGKTLYFSSKGHKSMGGFDIFKSVNQNGYWSQPENIGYPINTAGDDVHFVLTADGKNGYFTSSRTGTLGEQDIYKVGFDVSVPLILVKGVVRKEEPGEFNVSISVIDKATNIPEEFIYNPNKVTGKYLLILPPGKNYDMVVEAEGYQPYVVNINIPDQKEFYELYQEITLRKISKAGEVSQNIVVTNYFNNIREDKKSADLPVSDFGKVASSDYLQAEMNKLIAVSKSKDKNSDSALARIEKLNVLTDKVSDNFDRIVEAKMPTQVLTSTFTKEDDKKLEAMKVGNNTVYAVPSTFFANADIEKVIEDRKKASQSGELAQLYRDLDKAKKTPKTGNYIVDLANERYIENLEEEIASIEGGFAEVAQKEKKEYAVEVKKETGMYGTQTTYIIDKEKELAEREAAVTMKEAEQNELAKLREDLENAKSKKPSGNYITDLANQRYIENLEEEVAAISGGFSPKYKKKEGFAEVKKETGLYGTTTFSGVGENKETQGADLSAKEKELLDREKAIVKKETELALREKELLAREKDLAKREATLTMKDQELAALALSIGQNKTNEKGTSGNVTGKTMKEKIVFFEYNSSVVQSKDFADLDIIASTLSANLSSTLEISAHTDSKGTDEYNMSLSKRRAENVLKYLGSKGVKRSRVTLNYFGESKPLAPNANPDGTDNPEGRDKNRRAELKVKE